MKSGLERLNQAQYKASETMYKQAQASSQPGAGAPPPGGAETSARPNAEGGDVIDAEVVEEDKK